MKNYKTLSKKDMYKINGGSIDPISLLAGVAVGISIEVVSEATTGKSTAENIVDAFSSDSTDSSSSSSINPECPAL